MEFTTSEWNGFKRLDFKFNNRDCILICPETPCEGKKWLYRTEYFGAFADMELVIGGGGPCNGDQREHHGQRKQQGQCFLHVLDSSYTVLFSGIPAFSC